MVEWYCAHFSYWMIQTHLLDQNVMALSHVILTSKSTNLWKLKKLNSKTAAAAKSLQSCPTLCDPIDGSPPGGPVPGILQERTLEWVAISFSNAWKWKVKVKSLSLVRLLATPWTAAHQVPPSMGFSRQEYWSGVPLPSPNIKTEQNKSYRQVRIHFNSLLPSTYHQGFDSNLKGRMVFPPDFSYRFFCCSFFESSSMVSQL